MGNPVFRAALSLSQDSSDSHHRLDEARHLGACRAVVGANPLEFLVGRGTNWSTVAYKPWYFGSVPACSSQASPLVPCPSFGGSRADGCGGRASMLAVVTVDEERAG